MVETYTHDIYKFFKKCKFESNNWIVMGYVIYKLTKGSEKGYKLWHEYSVTNLEFYDAILCDKMWIMFKSIYDEKKFVINNPLTDVVSLSSLLTED